MAQSWSPHRVSDAEKSHRGPERALTRANPPLPFLGGHKLHQRGTAPFLLLVCKSCPASVSEEAHGTVEGEGTPLVSDGTESNRNTETSGGPPSRTHSSEGEYSTRCARVKPQTRCSQEVNFALLSDGAWSKNTDIVRLVFYGRDRFRNDPEIVNTLSPTKRAVVEPISSLAEQSFHRSQQSIRSDQRSR